MAVLGSRMQPSGPREPEVDSAVAGFRALQAADDRRLRRDALVHRHLGLARSLAERYVGRGIPRDDLHQVAVLGLVRAIDRFDPDRGAAFSSFAVPTILGEVRRHFRDHGWTVSVPRHLQELRQRADRVVSRLEQELGRRPSLTETASSLDADPDDVLLALDGIRSCYRPASLEAGTADVLAGHDPDPMDRQDTSLVVRGLLEQLPERQQRVVVLRYWAGLTQREIADRVGCSQMHVSRLLRRSLDHMHAAVVSPVEDANQ